MHATTIPPAAVPQAVSAQPDALLNLGQILGSTHRPGLLGIGRSKFYELIQLGMIPQPIKIGRRSLWRQSEIHLFIEWLARESRAEPRGLP